MKPPSAKASFYILTIVILSTLIFIVSEVFNVEKPLTQIEMPKILVESKITDYNLDSDGDGLMDWEEILWGTDPYKYDTDGDGTGDGEEVRLGRNPLVPGPNDKYLTPEEQILENIRSDSKINENSLTGQVAISFAENYFLMRGEEILDENNKKLLVQEITDKALKQVNLTNKYNLNSLRTFEHTLSQDLLLKYAQDYINKQVELVLVSAISLDNPNYLEIGDYFINQSAQLANMLVPNRISTNHLEMANAVYNLGFIIKEFKKEDEDPLYVMLLVPTYEKLSEKITNINNLIGNFLKENGIIIENNEIKIKND